MEYELEMWQLFQEGIFLIKGRSTKFDIVYKLVSKGDELYFCKVGGQSYKIKDIEEEYNKGMTREFFEKDKKNYVENRLHISEVKIDSKASIHTQINGGTITYLRNGKKEKYIIHPIHNAAIVERFFREIVGLQVNFIDREKLEREKFDGEFNPFEDKDTVQYRRAVRASKICNNIAWVTAFWFLLIPRPYFFILGVNLLLPLVGIFIYMKYNTFVELDEYKHRQGVNVLQCIIFPTLSVALRALNDFNIVYSLKFWIMISAISLVLMVIVLWRTKEYKVRKLVILELAVCIFIYTYGAFIHGNCILDKSSFFRYSVQVMESSKDKDSDPSYYLTVEPWGPYKEKKELEVTEGIFKRRKAGADVPIYLMEGRFGIQWYIIDSWYLQD